MPVAELKAPKKVQGTAAGTAIRPGRAGRAQTLCRGGPANAVFQVRPWWEQGWMTRKACWGGRAADRDEGQQHGGFGALS